MGYIPPYTLTSKILKLSIQITELATTLEIEEKKIITPRLRKKNRIKTLAGTLEIEGNFLGEEKITAILDGKRVLGSQIELAEVEGAINVYKDIRKFQYDVLDDLLKAYKILMKGIQNDAGVFRSVNVGVGGESGVSHIAPQYEMVPILMSQLFEWLHRSEEHSLIKSCVFHYEFEFIHPFSDGNGRIGRLWQSVILCHWKDIFRYISTESIIRDHQESYYQAIENSTKEGSATPFIEFMLESIYEAISSVKSSVNTDEIILQYLKDNPNATIKEIAEFLSLTTRAIEKQIANLKKENMLERVGSARKGYWEVL